MISSIIRSGSFRELFRVEFGVVSIFFSNKCNFLCGHCITNSGPGENSVIDFGKLVASLTAFAQRGRVAGLHMSGGEPLLFPDRVRLCAEFAQEHSLRAAINTNGYWIKSPNQLKFLRSNRKNITDIFISLSPWHLEFLKGESVRDAVMFCLDEDIRTELMITGACHDDFDHVIGQIFPGGLPCGVDLSLDVIFNEGRAAKLSNVASFGVLPLAGC